jgi:IS30 family transposase
MNDRPITRTRWTPCEIERFLKLFAEGLTHEAIGERLARTAFSIDGLARDLRQHRTHPAYWDRFQVAYAQRGSRITHGAQRFRWSADLDATLLRLTREKQSDSEIARQLSISRCSIKMRRSKIRELRIEGAPGAFDDPVLALAVSGSWRRAA